VLANGNLAYHDLSGSIHEIGRAIQNAPCNGWEHWYYLNDHDEYIVIDALREHIRQEARTPAPEQSDAADGKLEQMVAWGD